MCADGTILAMTAFRSSRLESLLGSQWDQASYAQIASLVERREQESVDLDFKSKNYMLPSGAAESAKDDKRFELIKDVAAMGNSAGGILILGIGEDGQARAKNVQLVDVSDQYKRWIDTAIAGHIYPHLRADVKGVESPDGEGRGFLIIAIPFSPSGPHAVLRKGGCLTYPRRSGTTTVFLSENEVAHAYRSRLSRVSHRQTELEQLHGEAPGLLRAAGEGGEVRVIVTLVPDMPGDHRMDGASFRSFVEQNSAPIPLVGAGDGGTFRKYTLRAGRYIAYGGGWRDSIELPCCSLLASGGGTVSISVPSEFQSVEGYYEINDDRIVDAVLGGLKFLARHARDRAATGGVASVMAQVKSNRGALRLNYTDPLVAHVNDGVTQHYPMASAMAVIDEMAEDGGPLVAATYELVAPLLHEFGVTEPRQVTRDGEIRLNTWWPLEVRRRYQSWAEGAGIGVIGD